MKVPKMTFCALLAQIAPSWRKLRPLGANCALLAQIAPSWRKLRPLGANCALLAQIAAISKSGGAEC